MTIKVDFDLIGLIGHSIRMIIKKTLTYFHKCNYFKQINSFKNRSALGFGLGIA